MIGEGGMMRLLLPVVAALAAASATALPGCGDDAGAASDADADTDADTDTDAGTDADTDTDTDTGTGTDSSYPDGPYGFDPSMELDTDFSSPGSWTGGGDVIPDICLPNALGDEVCLRDLYRSAEAELLFVDFTTMW
jgi:hypothetical protein